MAQMEITIKGQKIPLKSSAHPMEAEVLKLAQMLITNVEKRMKHGAPHQIALIALLDLAGEYVKAKDGTRKWKQKIYQTADQLANAAGDRV